MDQRQFFLRDILTVVFKHSRLIIIFPIVVLAIVAALSYLWPPTYESVAKVKIMRGREVSQADTTVTQSQQAVTLAQLSVEDVNSEIELMHSKDVLEATVLALNLHEDPGFPYGTGPSAMFVKGLRSAIQGVLSVFGLAGDADPVQQAMQDLDNRLITEHIRDSFVIEAALRLGPKWVTAQVDPDGMVVLDSDLELMKARAADDPTVNVAAYEASLNEQRMEQSQYILNVLIQKYVDHHIQVYRNPKSEPFFAKRRKMTQDELSQMQDELQKFRDEADIAMLDKQKELLLEGYTEALRVLAQLEESERIIDATDLDSSVISTLASETDSTVVREMQLRLLELVLERNRVLNSLGENHPTVQSLRQQVSKAQTDLIEAIATTKELTITKRDSVLAKLKDLNRREAEHARLEKEVEILTSNYEFYREKQEDAAVADQLALEQVSNVRVASTPTEPTEPVFPRKGLNMVLALIGGIVAALALAFFLDYLDHGVKTPEDIEYYLGIPPMASFFNRPGEPLNKGECERLSVMLDQMAGSDESSMIQVTSSLRGESAPQVARGLADAYGNDPEGSVLLLDLTGEAGGRSASAGITDVLTGQANMAEVFETGEAVTVVGRGAHSDGAFLWGTAQMKELVASLRGRYKYIVVNSGPVMGSHDALKLARHSDAVLMVIKADSTRREVVDRAVDMFADNKERVVGAVLTERTQKIPQAVYRRI